MLLLIGVWLGLALQLVALIVVVIEHRRIRRLVETDQIVLAAIERGCVQLADIFRPFAERA